MALKNLYTAERQHFFVKTKTPLPKAYADAYHEKPY